MRLNDCDKSSIKQPDSRRSVLHVSPSARVALQFLPTLGKPSPFPRHLRNHIPSSAMQDQVSVPEQEREGCCKDEHV